MRYGVFGISPLLVFLFISFGYLLLTCSASRPHNIPAFSLYILGLYNYGLFIWRFGRRGYHVSPFGVCFVSFSLFISSFDLGLSTGFVTFVIFGV